MVGFCESVMRLNDPQCGVEEIDRITLNNTKFDYKFIKLAIYKAKFLTKLHRY